MEGEKSMAWSRSFALSLLPLVVTKWWRVPHYAKVMQLHHPPSKNPCNAPTPGVSGSPCALCQGFPLEVKGEKGEA